MILMSKWSVDNLAPFGSLVLGRQAGSIRIIKNTPEDESAWNLKNDALVEMIFLYNQTA